MPTGYDRSATPMNSRMQEVAVTINANTKQCAPFRLPRLIRKARMTQEFESSEQTPLRYGLKWGKRTAGDLSPVNFLQKWVESVTSEGDGR